MNLVRFILSYIFLFCSLALYPFLVYKKKWKINNAQNLLMGMLLLTLLYNVSRGQLHINNNTFTMYIPIYYFIGFFLDKKRRILTIIFIVIFASICYFINLSNIDLIFGILSGTSCILCGSLIRKYLHEKTFPTFIESMTHTIILFFICMLIAFLLRLVLHYNVVVDDIRNIFISEYCIIYITINFTFILLEKICGFNKNNKEKDSLIRIYYKNFCKLAVVLYILSMILCITLISHYESKVNADLDKDGNITIEEYDYSIKNNIKINFEEVFFSTAIASEILTGFIIASFILVYVMFKKTIFVSLKNINSDLSKITSGNYDILCKENNSKEFENLSNSINITVDTLKKNIKLIEDKNKEELDLARKIQVSQFPQEMRDTIGYEIFAENVPALDVSGDFYDYIKIGTGRLLFLVADVSGKGIAASMFMMRAIQEIRKNAIYYNTLEELVTKTNLALCKDNDTMVFVTALFCMLDIKKEKLYYINAGHNPIIYNDDFLIEKNDRMLGVDENAKYHTKTLNLKENDRLFLYTDGVVEARNSKKEFYGNDRLKKCVKNSKDENIVGICNNVLKDIYDFVNNTIQFDDITELSFLYKSKHNIITFKTNDDGAIRGKNFIDEYLKLYEFGVDFVRNVKVVYDEICSNIIYYAYDGVLSDVTVELDIEDINESKDEKRGFKMVFIDSGKEFNPLTYKGDDVSLVDRINGGFGIMLCKKICSDIFYERKENKNILTMYFKKSHN